MSKLKGTLVAPGVIIHPHICSGAACVSGRRIMTEILMGRFCAGENPEDIAEDYDIELWFRL